MQTPYLQLHPEVQHALHNNRPVVALESTIISHGMPYPENVETALKVEAYVRQAGALPATIGLMDGNLIAGLSPAQIERIGQAGTKVVKTSRRDIPFVLQQKTLGATTVAATMIAAQLAGIRIFATGGIGGVHRGAEQSMDISADLQELARTNVAVVCAGAKSILDLTLTLEYLETHGVPVIGYQTDEFPAFFTRRSTLGVDQIAQNPEELATLLKLKWDIPLQGGVLIANPIPEQKEPAFKPLQKATEEALRRAQQQGITGKAITPFLLSTIEELTDGASLQANIELVLNNADLAARIAVAYADLATS